MSPQQAIVFFKNKAALASALDIRPETIWHWVKNKIIPFKTQRRIETLTKKRLKADAPLLTIEQLESILKKSDKKQLLKISAQNMLRWKKQGYIPHCTQRNICDICVQTTRRRAEERHRQYKEERQRQYNIQRNIITQANADKFEKKMNLKKTEEKNAAISRSKKKR